MCRGLVIEFFFENTTVEEFRGKKVLEIGSRYVNGSVRPFVERFLMPASYVGIDIEQGRYVRLGSARGAARLPLRTRTAST